MPREIQFSTGSSKLRGSLKPAVTTKPGMREEAGEVREKVGGEDPRATSTSGNIAGQSRDKDTLHNLTAKFLLLWTLGFRGRMSLLFDSYKHQRRKKKCLISESAKGL